MSKLRFFRLIVKNYNMLIHTVDPLALAREKDFDTSVSEDLGTSMFRVSYRNTGQKRNSIALCFQTVRVSVVWPELCVCAYQKDHLRFMV
jgi:hypothetical protein